jgi:hypothetical protein
VNRNVNCLLSVPPFHLFALTRVTDRRRYCDRRLHNEHYNEVQQASQAQRLLSRAQQADGASAVLFYHSFTDRPIDGIGAHTSFEQGNSWWSRFYGVMKGCRCKAPAWSRTCDKCHALLMDGHSKRKESVCVPVERNATKNATHRQRRTERKERKEKLQKRTKTGTKRGLKELGM